jgi:hypothetical protein
MKLVKSLLLGSAAGLVAAAGAQAADLPSRKAAPVDYVRVCPASLGYGAGFFVIPGTETCLRVSGRVRAEYLVGERFDGSHDGYGFRARGQIRVDARTQTAYGTLRTFINFEATNSSGTYNRGVNSTGPSTLLGGGAGAAGFNLSAAFVQFGPITAGRAQSFFDFYADAINWGPIRGSDTTLNLLAYTATFGGGFSATISLEDGLERRVALAGFQPGVIVLPGAFAQSYTGATIPDVVANLNWTQGWGSVQLSAALHQVRTGFGRANGGTVDSDTKYGFAVQGGLKLNLPMLAAGDVFYLQAAYAEGAISYLGYGGAGQGATWGANSRVGEVFTTNVDGVTDGAGRTRLAKGFAITAGLLHYWTPTVRQGIYGSYSQLDYPSSAIQLPAVGTGARPSGAIVGSNEIRLGTNLIWSPVAGLDIGVEVLYARVDPKGRLVSADQNKAVFGRTKGADDSWQGRFRIQRDF